MNSKWLFGVLFVICVLQLVACSRKTSDQNVDAEIGRLVHATISAGGILIHEAQISQTTSRVETEWEIATELSQQDYFVALKENVGSDYHVAQQTSSDLVLSRLLPGDAYEVHVKSFDGSAKQHEFRVHFVATPD